MKFRKERAIALIAGNGTLALTLGNRVLDAVEAGGAALENAGPRALALLVTTWGLWCSYRALRWAGKTTGDETKFGKNEAIAITNLAGALIGLSVLALYALYGQLTS